MERDENSVVLTRSVLEDLRDYRRSGETIRKGWQLHLVNPLPTGNPHILTDAELAIVNSDEPFLHPEDKPPTYIEYDPATQVFCAGCRSVINKVARHLCPQSWGAPDQAYRKAQKSTPKNAPIVLPDDTLRDHINDLVMQVLAREKQKANAVWTQPEIATLRDQFAMAALTGMISDGGWQEDGLAQRAYEWSDAMLEARAGLMRLWPGCRHQRFNSRSRSNPGCNS